MSYLYQVAERMTHRDGLTSLLARSRRRGGARYRKAVGDNVQKACEAAVPVVTAGLRRASKSLDDAIASPAASLLPEGLL